MKGGRKESSKEKGEVGSDGRNMKRGVKMREVVAVKRGT